MTRFDSEKEFLEFFDEQFCIARSPVILEIENETVGTDYGATSWSTPAQVDDMIDYLALEESSRHLDIGAGTGWPGLYVGSRTGCHVTLLDYPSNGLILAIERAREDGIDALATSGDAAMMPFPPAIFDGISHSDVMCCLSRKVEALEECRRVCKDDGAITFTVIEVTSGLTPAGLAQAVELGPEFVESDGSYPELLSGSGWRVERTIDLTDEFATMARLILAARERRWDRLVDLLGEDDAELSITRSRGTIAALGEGVLRRRMYFARA